MPVGARLAGFALVLAAVGGVGYAAGSAVGPIRPSVTADVARDRVAPTNPHEEMVTDESGRG
jgi:hypothetical protein